MGLLTVTRTYLELNDPRAFEAAPAPSGLLRLERVEDCPPSFFRHLYQEVGRRYRWVDRLGWTDERIREHLARPGTSLWVLYEAEAPAGYFELEAGANSSTEIAYFGLLPGFLGRGLGKHLLTLAVGRAREAGARRIWLHTCTLDDPAALPNYLRRGFQPYKEESYVVDADDPSPTAPPAVDEPPPRA